MSGQRDVRAPVRALREGERVVSGELAHYLGVVLRLRAGDGFTAFDPEGATEADVSIDEVRGGRLRVRVGPLRAGRLRASRAITWIQGLAKGPKCDAVVRDATELGATRIVVAQTARSAVRVDAASSRGKHARWLRVGVEASRQSGRGEAPVVEGPCPWDEALRLADADAARFCLYERASEPLAALLGEALARGDPLAFAAGPEGGLTDEEVAHARAAGWSIVSLGPRILRTETTAAAVLGAVAVWGG